MYQLSNLNRFIVLLFILTVSTTFSQSKYKTTDSREITKKLGEYTTSSKSSLSENLFDIPKFSHTASLYKIINFEELIKNEEMVTVFISDNNAFAHLSEKERKGLLSASNKEQLKEIVSYYIIPGRVDEHSIRKAISDGNGSASFRTLNGKTIRFLLEDYQIYLYTDNGSKSKLMETNFRHNKGFFHLTDGFAIPQK
ncbi:MAG: fasciclin domain-containing protein [Flavobacteriaceae bacterium]